MGSPGRRRNVLRLAKSIGAVGDLRDVGRKAGTIWKGVLLLKTPLGLPTSIGRVGCAYCDMRTIRSFRPDRYTRRNYKDASSPTSRRKLMSLARGWSANREVRTPSQHGYKKKKRAESIDSARRLTIFARQAATTLLLLFCAV